MTPLEAIEKSTVGLMRLRGSFDGVELWSDGHILAPADFPGRDHAGPAKVWGESLIRTGEMEAVLGPCVDGGRKVVYRAMDAEGMRVWINEAYRQAFQSEGVTAHVIAKNSPIIFRMEGKLIGLAMPIVGHTDETLTIEPTDGAVWASISCAENVFFRQSRADIRAALKAEYGDAVSIKRRAQDRRDESIDEIEEAENEISQITDKLIALDAMDKAEAEALATA